MPKRGGWRIGRGKALERLRKRGGWRCHYCDMPLHEKDVTLDHVIPRSKGGTNEISNLRVSCQRCNTSKGSKSAVEFWDEFGMSERAEHEAKP